MDLFENNRVFFFFEKLKITELVVINLPRNRIVAKIMNLFIIL